MKKIITNRVSILTIIYIVITTFVSCSKLVEVDAPVNVTTGSTVYNNDATASAVLIGIYAQLSKGSFVAGQTSLALYAGLSADELDLITNTSNANYWLYYRNNLNASIGQIFWDELYAYIYKANDIIEGIDASSSLSEHLREQLMGEAKFIRAYCYFYLVNLYGDVPLVTNTNYKENSTPSREPAAKVYNLIISDLIAAKELLRENYVGSDGVSVTAERTRPNKWVASALLARVYLFNKDYENAIKEASAVISNTSLYDTVPLNDVFLKNSKEAIWQLQPIAVGRNTLDGNMFIIPDSGPNSYLYSFYLSSFLLKDFEPEDLRRKNWVDSVTANSVTYFFPYKYKVNTYDANVTEYQMVFRLSEQYLIRAEANAQLGDIIGAKKDLDVIRRRAGLPNTAANTKEALVLAIEHERQVELFTESGHRWLDLKRTGRVNTVMSQITPLKGGTWKSDWQFYPISATELQRNKNLAQNNGY